MVPVGVFSAMQIFSRSNDDEEDVSLSRIKPVTGDSSSDLNFDLYGREMSLRPMPMYSVPGLVDKS